MASSYGSSYSSSSRRAFVPRDVTGKPRVQREFGALGGQIAGLVTGPINLGKALYHTIFPAQHVDEQGNLVVSHPEQYQQATHTLQQLPVNVGRSFLRTARDVLPATAKDAAPLEHVLPFGQLIYRGQKGTFADTLAEDFGNVAAVFGVAAAGPALKSAAIGRTAEAAAQAGDFARASALREEALQAANVADKIRHMPTAPLTGGYRAVQSRTMDVAKGAREGSAIESGIGRQFIAQAVKREVKAGQRTLQVAKGTAERHPYNQALVRGGEIVQQLARKEGTRLPVGEAKRLVEEEVRFRAEGAQALRERYLQSGTPQQVLDRIGPLAVPSLRSSTYAGDARLQRVIDEAVTHARPFSQELATPKGLEVGFTRDPRAIRLNSRATAIANNVADLRQQEAELQFRLDRAVQRESGGAEMLDRQTQMRAHLRGMYAPGHAATQFVQDLNPDIYSAATLGVDERLRQGFAQATGGGQVPGQASMDLFPPTPTFPTKEPGFFDPAAPPPQGRFGFPLTEHRRPLGPGGEPGPRGGELPGQGTLDLFGKKPSQPRLTTAVPPPAGPADLARLGPGLTGEAGYAYHGTSFERAGAIADEGKLRTHKPHEYTEDQQRWPDGGKERRAYFNAPERAGSAHLFVAPNEGIGQPVVLRVPLEGLQAESGTRDLFSRKAIPAEKIEILGADGQWRPVTEVFAKPGPARAMELPPVQKPPFPGIEAAAGAQVPLQGFRERVRDYYAPSAAEDAAAMFRQPEISTAPLGQIPLALQRTREFAGQSPEFPPLQFPEQAATQRALQFGGEPVQPRLEQRVPAINKKTGAPIMDIYGRPAQKTVRFDMPPVAQTSGEAWTALKDLRGKIADQEKLLGRTQRSVAKLDDRITLRRVPAQLQPFYAAVQRGKREILKSVGEGLMSVEEAQSILQDVPATVSGVLDLMASGQLPVPVHFHDLSESAARALSGGRPSMFSRARNLKTQIAGARKTRTGALREAAGPSERLGAASPVDSHIAAAVDVMKEPVANGVVDFVGQFARPFDADHPLLPGFVQWDPAATRRAPTTILQEPEGMFAGRREQQPVATTGPGGYTQQIPAAMKRAVDRHFVSGYANLLSPTTGIMNTWRAAVLYYSPRWVVNSVVGNLMLSAVEGSAFDLKAWRDAFAHGTSKIDVAGEQVRRPYIGVPADVTLGGFSTELSRTGGPLAHTRIAKGTRLANQWTDDFFRSLVYSHNVRKQARRLFLETGDMVNPDAIYEATSRGAKLNEAETKVVAGAADRARKMLVDYADLTPFERSAVRAVIPFYSWQKGILKLALSLPIDHPTRFAAINAVSNWLGGYSQEERQAYPEYLVNSASIAGHRLSTRGLNPFADAFSLIRPGAGGLRESVNPFLTATARSVLGAPERPGGPQEVNQYGVAEPQVAPNDLAVQFLRDLPEARILPFVQPADRPIDLRQQLLSYIGGVTERTPEQVAAAQARAEKARRAVYLSQQPPQPQGGGYKQASSKSTIDFFRPRRVGLLRNARFSRALGGG